MALTILQAPSPSLPKLSGQLLWAALPLIGALLLAALVIYFVDRWRKRAAAAEDVTAPTDQLSHFRSLYERGEMSPEEFERVKALLAGQLRRELKLPGPHPAAPPAADPVAPPAGTQVQVEPPPPNPPREALPPG
jgi:hypothetical protein